MGAEREGDRTFVLISPSTKGAAERREEGSRMEGLAGPPLPTEPRLTKLPSRERAASVVEEISTSPVFPRVRWRDSKARGDFGSPSRLVREIERRAPVLVCCPDIC